MSEIVNAVIDSVFLGIEDHGALTASVFLKYGDGSIQGFGNYCLGDDLGEPSWAGYFIYRVLEVCGVRDWSKLQGRAVRVARQEGWNGKIFGIGHIVNDDWFYPEEDFEKGWPELRKAALQE
jgi:hypothetical protein